MIIAEAIVDWAALGKGALFALVGAVGFVTAFSLVVLASSRIVAGRRELGHARLADVAVAALAGLVCLSALVLALLAMMHKT